MDNLDLGPKSEDISGSLNVCEDEGTLCEGEVENKAGEAVRDILHAVTRNFITRNTHMKTYNSLSQT
jgi:hypothetical protein